VQDVTEQIQAQALLHKSEERFAFAVEGAGDGVWDWNMRTGEMLLSRLYEKMLDYDEHELPQTIEAWQQSVHPEDLAQVQANLQDYLAGGVDSYVMELRLQCKAGGYKWVLCRGTVVERDAANKPIRMIGIHTDIDERKKNEETLRLFRRIFETSVHAIGVASAEGKLLYINPAHERMHQYRQADIEGKPFTIFMTEEALAHTEAIIEATSKGESWVGQLAQKRSDGSEFISASHIGALLGNDGKPQYIFNILYDYTDELNRQAELRNARDKAESANKVKSEFVASMSHELRTPMNAILGYTQLMESDLSITADNRENLLQISKAGWHLLDLINEVLDLAKVEAGEVTLEIENISSQTVVNECLSLVSPLILNKQISLNNQIVEENVVRADYMKLKQVLLNLLSNAIKYNRDGGAVVVSSEIVNKQTLHLSISDTGEGMSADQLTHLFQPFTRFGDTERVQGTGIGLSICKKLVEQMQGSIQVRSVEGKGSTFTLVLSLSSTQAAPVQKPTGGLSLLYIEDDAAQQALLGKWASTQGWQIEFAHDAAFGIDAAMKQKHDVILLDIDLPGGFSGLDVKSVLDEMESMRTTPVIGISNHVQPDDVEKAMQAGFAAYLHKPVDLLELERTIQKAMRKGDDK